MKDEIVAQPGERVTHWPPHDRRGWFELFASVVLVGAVAYSLFAFPWVEDPENWTWCIRTGPVPLKVLTILWDAAIFTAYAWIPFDLLLTWLGLEVRPAGRLLILYGTFIVFCGFTHGADGLNIWLSRPYYWIAMKIKAMTGAISLAVAYVTETRRPDMLSLGRQGRLLREQTAKAEHLQKEAEGRAARVEAIQGEIEEKAASEALARKQAEVLAADLEKALAAQDAQIARNAQLMAELNVARDQAQQRAQRAEGKIDTIVADRDDAQRYAGELREVNARLERALSESAAASERIDLQARAIEELETPIIPIWPEIDLCPIVGPLDSQRAERLMSAMMGAVVADQVRVMILDLTGVRVVDTAVAGWISRAAAGVRLLGAECIITGIGPDIAAAIISLGLEMPVRTMQSVQVGLGVAIRLIKRQI